MTDDSHEHVMDLVPDNATVMQSIRVVQYFDETGDVKYRSSFRGDSPISSTLGLLDLVKHQVLRAHADE